MKIRLLFILLIISFSVSAQRNDSSKYNKSYDYGTRAKRIWLDSVVVLPNGTVIDRSYVFPTAWRVDGNAGTSAGTNFIGTTDAQPLWINTNGVNRLIVPSGGIASSISSTDSVLVTKTDGVTIGKIAKSALLTIPISYLRAATSSNEINNLGYNQRWNWNSLSTGVGLAITSNSGTMASGSGLVSISSIGSNVSGSTTMLGVVNNNQGVGTTSIGLYASASQASDNIAITTYAGDNRFNTFNGSVEIGKNTTNNGRLKFNGSTSGTITIQPAVAAGTWTMTLPTTDGNANEFLQTDGSGVTSWAAVSSGSTNTGVGSGFQVAINGTNNIKSLTSGYGITADSVTSNQVNYKVDSATLSTKYNRLADTASMLTPYLRKVDTTAMLTPYLRSNLAAATYGTISNLALKVNISDTATMLSPYLRSNVGAATYLPLVGANYGTTTGTGLALTSSTVTTGNLMSLTNTGTVATSNTKNVLAIVSSGANGTASQTVTGQTISVTNTGTTNTNVGLLINASGASTNNAIVATGNVIVTGVISASSDVSTTGSFIGNGISSYILLGSSGYFYCNNRFVIRSASDGVVSITNNAGTDFGRLQLGGTTSSFPAIARNGTYIEPKLADGTSGGGLVTMGVVGIGTTSPTTKLQVNSGTALKVFSLGSSATGSYVEKAFIDSSGNASIKGFSTGYVAKTANYTATISDYVINCTANTFTVTLLSAVGIAGQTFTITNSGTGVVTLATTSSQTFSNVVATPTTLTLNQFATVSVVSNGANWLRTTSL